MKTFKLGGLTLGSGVGKTPFGLSDGVQFNNGKVVLQFDDAWESVYTNGLPLFTEKGVKITTFANTYLVNTQDLYNGFHACNWAQLREMSALGHDIQCHGYRGYQLQTLTEAQIIAELVDNTAGFVANGLPAPTEIAYSGGGYNDLALKVVDDYRRTGRTTQNVGFVNRKSNKFELIEGTGFSGNIADIKKDMDYAKKNKLCYILAGHMIGVSDPLSSSVALIGEAIDYGKSIGLDFITTKELYNLMIYNDIRLSRDCPDNQIDISCPTNLKNGISVVIEKSTDGVNFNQLTTLITPNKDYSDTDVLPDTNYYYRTRAFYKGNYLPYSRVASVSTPVTMTIKSRGDGTGVTTVLIKTTRAMTITLSGNARFYTNSAGTLGESSSYSIPYNTLTTLYIKCTSGQSTLMFPNNKITIINQSSITTNSPSFAFDISKFSNLKTISFPGYNEISGSITNLINLESIYLGDANTVGGSITNLTNLTYIQLFGTNTVGGSITNLINLTYLYNFSTTHTITGSITNLTELTFLYLRNTSTLSGLITNLTKLTSIELIGTTIGGDVSNLTKLTKLSIISTGNTLSGSLTNLTLLTIINVEGSNTLSGDLSNHIALTSLTIKGNNTVSGDIGVNNVVNGITSINLNPCGMINYTGVATWSNATVTINPSAGFGYSSSEIDAILIDMANSPTLISKTITLKGANAARTSASDAAVSVLTGAGRTNTLALN